MIPYGRQDIRQDDIDAVVEILRSDYLTQGPAVPAFERAIADKVTVRHAVAVNSATSALHIACLSLGVGHGDTVWTAPVTFVASANCALYCGATVDFVDIDPSTYNMSVHALRQKLEQAEKSGRLPKVVIPVHLGGQSCEMKEIHALGRQYGFGIIEDASHAIGGRYRGDPVGNCAYSDIAVFSFHPVKIITTGEGGMAVTNDDVLAERMRLLRTHGITRDADKMTHEPDGPWYYQQIALGFNYRMTDMQAALGLSQLARLDDYIARRHVISRIYDDALADLPLLTPWQHPDCHSAFHLYVVRLLPDECGITHRELFESLSKTGVGVNLHYIPVHLQPYFRSMGFAPGQFRESENYYAQAVSLPMYPALSEESQSVVIEGIRSAFRK